MGMKRKIVSLLLCLVMVLSLVPAMAFATDAENYNVLVNGDEFKSDYLEITCGSGKATYDPDTNTLTLDNAKIDQTYLGYGIYAESALKIVLKGSNSTTNLYAILAKGDLTVTGEGSLSVTGTGQSDEPTIYADGGKAVFDCAGDITVDSKTTCVSGTNDVTLAGSGKITMESSRSGSMAVESVKGDVIISGSGEVSLKGDAHAVGAALQLNGEATPITLSALYSGTAVDGTVAGTAIDNYDVTGDPASTSVTYKLKTPCNHSNTEVRDAEEATCTEPGYTGDTYCTDCGEKIADGTPIDAKGHSYEDYVCACGAEDLTGAKENAKETILAEQGDDTSEAVVKAVEDALAAIEAATTVDEVNAAMEDGIAAIQAAKADDIAPVPVTYSIISGANSVWTKGSSDDIIFTSDAPFVKFVGVKVDGKTIAANNYTAKEGSTVITLAAAYLETLETGKHSIEIVSTDGSASTNFTVKADSQPADDIAPQTGDGSMIYLWVLILVAGAAGLSATTVYGRKRKHN